MNARLDSTLEFEESQLQINSWQRGSVDRSVAGLDGVVSVDLGRRSRMIVQKGIVRADNDEQLTEKIESFALLVDGDEHTLTRGRSHVMTGLRVSSFSVDKVNRGGSGVWCEFEIRYVQMRVQ
ncbi:MAG: hypothetical protein KAS23_05815 [Anaerohalosphaera sp.]|nr:hypothetical protein [Anaerohalosphaera sp.]